MRKARRALVSFCKERISTHSNDHRTANTALYVAVTPALYVTSASPKPAAVRDSHTSPPAYPSSLLCQADQKLTE
ncbi:hypothetical protein RRG08_052695 [Elysia crispata]|uniref:Uncharacterized protein n=1 Tax=Elysia crispata TaxID=231223 RepID=A0AAE1B5E4_9GAST|nr:hypothetical protein RRG08_052695 [Elysia crispata]